MQSDIQNNLTLQPKYKFGIGYAVDVIRSGELMNEGINPLEYAEQNLNSEDQLEEFLSKMILGIMLWTKCNDIRTDFSSCINEYSFHSLPVLREKLKTNRNDYPLGDLLQELILSNTIATTEVFDTPTTLELIASLSSCDTLTETQIAILSVMPFNDSMPALSLSHGAKEALLESFETAE